MHEYHEDLSLTSLSFEMKDIIPENIIKYANTIPDRVSIEFNKTYAEGQENNWPACVITQLTLVSGWLDMTRIFGKINPTIAEEIKQNELMPLIEEMSAMRDEYAKRARDQEVSHQSLEPGEEEKVRIFTAIKDTAKHIAQAMEKPELLAA